MGEGREGKAMSKYSAKTGKFSIVTRNNDGGKDINQGGKG